MIREYYDIILTSLALLEEQSSWSLVFLEFESCFFMMVIYTCSLEMAHCTEQHVASCSFG